MVVRALDHVQIAMPAGGETKARAFYQGLLGIPEVKKPTNLAGRGGCWFACGNLGVHLGIEADFRPARKAHPAFIVDDLSALITKLTEAGCEMSIDEPLAGRRRIFVADPFGNRIELIELLSG
jgi:catechol 2,3-dioxygenase-like lactoylglutathione lyase family enzyme